MFRGSAFLIFLNVLLLLFNVVSQIVIASYFGSGSYVDSFTIAISVPNYIQGTLFTGIPFVLIPMLIDFGKKKDYSFINKFLNKLIIFIFILTVIISSVIYFYSSDVVNIIYQNLDSDNKARVSLMLKDVIWTIPFSSIIIVLVSQYNSQKEFFIPILSQIIGVILNTIIIISLKNTDYEFRSLTLALLVSIIIQALILLWPKRDIFSFKSNELSNFHLKLFFNLLFPIILFGLIGKLDIVFENYYAYDLPEGTLSYMMYGAKLATIVNSILGAAIATAAFPIMVEAYLLGDKIYLKEKYLEAMELVILICAPIVILVSVQRVSIVKFFYERGNFSEISTLYVAELVPIYMMITLLNIIGTIIGRALYVQNKTFSFNFFGAVSIIFYPVFVDYFKLNFGYIGLCFSTFSVRILALFFGLFLIWTSLKVFLNKKIVLYFIYAIFTGIMVFYQSIFFKFDNNFLELIVNFSLGLVEYLLIVVSFNNVIRGYLFNGFRKVLLSKFFNSSWNR